MEGQTIEKVKQLWGTWDIRFFILASLCIQALLSILAPFRKTSASGILSFFIWVFYLSADAIAVFVIGLVASNEADIHNNKKEILAFWAPFLLLHLGGPDTITALALEDNELWHRHALQLVTQVIITIYVFVLSFRHNGGLVAPTLLMFVHGLWKYYERTCALFYASADSFRDSLVGEPEPGPNYARLMEEYFCAQEAHIPTEFKGDNARDTVKKSEETYDPANQTKPTDSEEIIPKDVGKLTDNEKMVAIAHLFYDKFKTLLADGFLSLKDRKESRDYFLEDKKAFEIIEIELNLIYDVFYTKLFLVKRKRALARFICFFVVTASLFLFCFKDRTHYGEIDVIITFVLLGGAIALDLCAAVMLILSDWWIILIHDLDGKSYNRWIRWFMMAILRISRWARRPKCRRWSESISRYNLLNCFFREPPSFFRVLPRIKRVKDFLIGWLYVDIQKADETLIQFITDELKMKARQAEDIEVAKQVCSARGNLVLQNDYYLLTECLRSWTVDVDYDESLLIWHLATDICYWNSVEKIVAVAPTDSRTVSKALSDYMSYLLLRQQTMLSSVVGMSDTRYEDTCADAKKFRSGMTTPSQEHTSSEEAEASFFKDFSKKLLDVKADVRPIIAKGDKSKSVLFDACRLAMQLEMFGEELQWEITSKVWLELLCYAAVRCTPRSHIAQLSKGGELVTLVWLLMAHLGLGERFLQNQGFGWTKLIIHK